MPRIVQVQSFYGHGIYDPLGCSGPSMNFIHSVGSASMDKTEDMAEKEVGFDWWIVWCLLGLTFGNLFIGMLVKPSGLALAAIVVQTFYLILALMFNKYAFLVATVLSLNPILWVVNGIYLSNRWNHPKVNKGRKTEADNNTIPLWWRLDKDLRLLIVLAVIWSTLSYLLQDKYGKDMALVFLPPFALLGFYFAFKHLVVPEKEVKGTPHDATSFINDLASVRVQMTAEGAQLTYGVTPDNPIRTDSIISSIKFLESLTTKQDQSIRYNRVGSIKVDAKSKPVDCYDIIGMNGEIVSRIYMSIYSEGNLWVAPAGLKLRDWSLV